MLGEVLVGFIDGFDCFLQSFSCLIEPFNCQLLTDSFVLCRSCLFRSLWRLSPCKSRLCFSRCGSWSQSGARILARFLPDLGSILLFWRLRLGLFHVFGADRLLVVVLGPLGAALANLGIGRLLRLVGLDDIV